MSVLIRATFAAAILAMPLAAQASSDAVPSITGTINGSVERVAYRGRPALHLVPAPDKVRSDEGIFAIVTGTPFTDGVIEAELAGAPRPDAPADSRGFVGIAFRTGPDASWSEIFYLRPTNARVDDQVRRNRSVQYVSDPEWPWYRLREESPGKYESYADLETGAWTRIRIEVRGHEARLFVNGATQPALVVTDLKHGNGPGQVALWGHVQTDAYFGELRITRR